MKGLRRRPGFPAHLRSTYPAWLSRAVEPGNEVLVLGASGDLTARLLLPGLGGLLASGGGQGLLLVGSGRDDWDDARWRHRVAESFSTAGADGAAAAAVIEGTRYLPADVTLGEDLRRLLDACRGRIVLFFALPPEVTAKACRAPRSCYDLVRSSGCGGAP